MLKLLLLLCIAFSSVAISRAACGGDLKTLDAFKYPNARCLDNSVAGYYFKEASSPINATKWHITLEGGGECVTQRSCTARSKTELGSSTGWATFRSSYGLQACTADVNPDFHDWNHVYIPYCSGDLFLGMDEDVSERAWGLRFSGYHHVMAVLDNLYSKSFSAASIVVLSGESAGAIGAVALADEVFDSLYVVTDKDPRPYQTYKRTVDKQALRGPRVVLVPIAGYYFSGIKYTPTSEGPAPVGYIKWTYDDLKTYQTLWNAFVPSRCALDGKSNTHECIFAARSYATLSTDAFFIHSQNDAVVMTLHGGLPPVWTTEPKQCTNSVSNCPANIVQYATNWNKAMWAAMAPVLDKTNQFRVGAFVPACLMHTSFGLKTPLVDGRNYIQALNAWMWDDRNNNVMIDKCGDGLFCGQCPAT